MLAFLLNWQLLQVGSVGAHPAALPQASSRFGRGHKFEMEEASQPPSYEFPRIVKISQFLPSLTCRRAAVLALARLRSKRDDNPIQRRVAIDEVDTLPGNTHRAVDLHESMQARAAEQALIVAAVLQHDEF